MLCYYQTVGLCRKLCVRLYARAASGGGGSGVPDEGKETSHFGKIDLLRQRKAAVALLPVPLWLHVWQKGLEMGTQH